MKKALLIGGTGLLGRGITREFLKAGWQVTLLSRGASSLPADLVGCSQLIADRKQSASLQQALKGLQFDCIVDCAAYTREDAQIALDLLINITPHYWFISTDFVYAADPFAHFPLCVDARKQTQPPYAGNKGEAEALLHHAAQKHARPLTILRPPHIMGDGRPAGCDPAAGGRDEQLVQRIRKGESIPLLAGGQFLIQPVWSREVGRCILALQLNPESWGSIYNCAGAACVSTFAYYSYIAEICGAPLHITSVDPVTFASEHPQQAHIARHRCYDIQPLQQLGFTPSLNLKDALQETLAPWL
ncbi:NAD-dependent epimerase/dehydratase family protein [Kiritimatiellota bacterium B12222]|nr:NAD-dependent epimerase/dehydratase family protein [Kiritimatiellota bacterium B12222]